MRRSTRWLLGAPEGGSWVVAHGLEPSCDSGTCTRVLSALEWYWRPYSRMMVFERVYVRARMCMTLFVTPTDAVGSATVRGTIAEHRNEPPYPIKS